MPFNQNWYDDNKLARLTAVCERARPLAGAVVEIGCWEGRSTVAIANAVYPDVVQAVDHWQGTIRDETGLLAQERDIQAAFWENIAEKTKGNVAAHAVDWRFFAERWTRPIKLIHLDAGHQYEEVRDQIRAFTPLLVQDGILCGDDYDEARNEGVVRAVRELYKPVLGDTAFWYWVKP